MKKNIYVKGARTHNLKNINIEIPRDKLITITGLSGSGKSSLAFDTIFAEGQRRYIESLSSYARQFLSMMDKPDVDTIEGLSPAISIEQKSSSHNPRSTVGTVTEIYDYLRLLFARVGQPKCPEHNVGLEASTTRDIAEKVLSEYEGEKIMILAPVVKQQKGEHNKLIDNFEKQGYMRIRINDEIFNITDDFKINPKSKNTIEIVVDRLKLDQENRLRISESLETASKITDGLIHIADMEKNKIKYIFSTKFSCPHCGYSLSELEPRLFSFNSPIGACSGCDGLGVREFFDPDKIIVSKDLNLENGAIKGWDKKNMYFFQLIESLSLHYKVNINKKYKSLPEFFKKILFYGSENELINFKYYKANSKFSKSSDNKYIIKKHKFKGIVNIFDKKYNETDSYSIRENLAQYLSTKVCSECDGSRLNEKVRNVFISGKSISDITSLTIEDCYSFFNKVKFSGMKKEISSKIILEIKNRLVFLNDVGLNYLTLNRNAETLSGGESQRIRLASQIGSGLVGVMYILDEPSIGLHQRDNKKLLDTLRRLRDLGNTVIVVEHDEETILSSDYVIDMGVGAGEHGGTVVYCGEPKGLTKIKNSYTGQYISGKRNIALPKKRLKFNQSQTISLKEVHANNLKKININIPIGLFTCITGVSGSGKSTLINDVLFNYIVNEFNGNDNSKIQCKKIDGIEHIDKIIDIDQSPIGRTPRSNPATYTGIFTHIRDLFSQTKESKSRGYKPGRFSFNVNGGRCDSCDGDGVIKVEMHFLPDIYVKCDKCKGQRYNKETLEIIYKSKNINDILNFTIEEALRFFKNIPVLRRKLEVINEVGLSYIKLGQNAVTLSGGEAQRIKLAKELIKRDTGRTLYVLDEPTTGLHFYDVEKLLKVLKKLRDRGNTIIVIEHNLDVIKTSDWVIDLGPEGGNGGGKIIASGTPENVSTIKESYTGKFLKDKI